jgi:hypothetical protein
MAKQKFDGVIEAVRYQPDGQIQWVRAYVRRGVVFSDRMLLDRKTLVEQLKAGKNYMVGRRMPLMASTFEVSGPVRLVEKDGQEVIVTGERGSSRDSLEGVPII